MEKLSLPTSIPEEPIFLGFDVEDFWQVPGYQRNLPHWRLMGATYFVTFRLADSLPERVLRQWALEQEAWLHAHDIALNWRKEDPERFYHALAAIPNEERQAFERKQARQFFLELDHCHGACLLRYPEAAKVVHDALLCFHGQRIWTGDFIIMPNHVHAIVQPFPGVKLEEWIYSIKRFTATQLGREDEIRESAIKRSGHLWQTESFDRVIRDPVELVKTRNYIAKNPGHLKDGEYLLHRATWPL